MAKTFWRKTKGDEVKETSGTGDGERLIESKGNGEDNTETQERS